MVDGPTNTRGLVLGYNTNGMAHHRLADSVEILDELGYRSVAITLECEHLDPPNLDGVARCTEVLRAALNKRTPRVTIETGSRFILDPRRKHQPTLISADRAERHRRIDFLKASVDVASSIDADCVSLWSGTAGDTTDSERLWDRLIDGLSEVLRHAESCGVRIAFEPEPGMLISTMADFDRLTRTLDHPLLGLTLDVGHVYCLADGDAAEHIHRWSARLWNVHIEDMKRGRHEHLMFGEGEMNFGPIFTALSDVAYDGPVHVELSRHSHNAVETARRAYEFLQPYLTGIDTPGAADREADA